MSAYDRITQSKFYSLGNKLGDLIIISLLWLVFSLPIITLGPSTSALYYATTRRFYHNSQAPRKDFMHSFRMNLKQGVLLTLICIVYGGLIVFDIYVARNGLGDYTLPAFYEQVAYVLLIPIILTLPYLFAYLSRFSTTLRTIIKHSMVFSIIHPFHAIGLLLIAAVSGAVMIVFPPSALLIPVGGAYLCSKWIERDFDHSLHVGEENDDHDENTEKEALSDQQTDRVQNASSWGAEENGTSTVIFESTDGGKSR